MEFFIFIFVIITLTSIEKLVNRGSGFGSCTKCDYRGMPKVKRYFGIFRAKEQELCPKCSTPWSPMLIQIKDDLSEIKGMLEKTRG